MNLHRAKGLGRMVGIGVVTVMLCVVFLLPAAALAHTPGAPRLEEVELEPIYIMDGGKKIEITLDDFKNYYSEASGGKSSIKSVFAVCAYRAVQTALAELWGEEIPRREDLSVSSALPIPHSFLFLHMVVRGEPLAADHGDDLQLLLKPGHEAVPDLSFTNLELLSRQAAYEDFEYRITRKDTGESITLLVDRQALGADYLDLWKKAVFSLPEPPTADEQRRYARSYTLSDKLMQMEEYKLFADRPAPLTAATIGGIVLVAGFILTLIIGNINDFRKSRALR